jgi:hypothetical protein
MNQLAFLGKITDLYAEDYQYLQTSINEELLKIVAIMIQGGVGSSIVSEFVLEIDPSDSTKLYINQNGEIGRLLSTSGLIIESTTNVSGITLSDYTLGVVNGVYAKCESVYASHDRKTDTIVEEQKAIDFRDYSLVYNRLIDKLTIVVYTTAEYAALTTTEKENLVLLGETTAQGTGNPLTAVDLTNVIYMTLRLTDNTIEVRHLAHDFMLPQTMVLQTSTASIDDRYAGTPSDLEDDLNKIRTQIRNLKGTFRWDDYLAGIKASDPDMNELHRTGIFPNAYNTYDYLLTSSGTVITIDSGKVLLDRDIKEDQEASLTPIYLAAGDSFLIGDYDARTGSENHTIPNTQPYSFNLTYGPVQDVYVVRNSYPLGAPYVEGVDYTVDYTYGIITTIVGGDIVNETVDVYYTSGSYRCDLIAVNINGFHYFTGTPTTTLIPQPPAVSSSGLLPLYYIYRYPMQDYVEDNDIVSGRIFTQPVKEVRELDYTTVASYNGATFNSTHTAALNKLNFFDASTNLVLQKGTNWDTVTGNVGTNVQFTNDAYLQTFLYTKDRDELWILVEPGTTQKKIQVEFESVPGSGTLDYIKEVAIEPAIRGSEVGVIPILITSTGFSQGVTKLKLTITKGDDLTFWKILIGRTDLLYLQDIFEYYRKAITATYNTITLHSDEIASLGTILDQQDALNLEQEIRLNYIEQKASSNNTLFTELYLNRDNIAEPSITDVHPFDVLCDNDWNNNWKEKLAGSPPFKNGFARPQRQSFQAEVINKYDLRGIGLYHKGGISQYDSVNNCYWMISNNGTNAIGEITKLSSSLQDNKVIVEGRWYLTAGGPGSYWSGIDVDSDGTKLWFTLAHASASAIYGVVINTDGTIGQPGYEKASGEYIDTSSPGSDSTYAVGNTTASGPDDGYYNDVIEWNDSTVMVLVCNGTTVSLINIPKADLIYGATADITGLGLILGGTDSNARSIAKFGDTIYVRANDITTDYRYIYCITTSTGIFSNAFVKACGRFPVGYDADPTATSTEGITISRDGDLLEITSYQVSGPIYYSFLSRLALNNAEWYENQISEVYAHNASTNPAASTACMVEDSRYYWTADTGVTATEVDIYRFDTTDGSVKHARINNTGYTGIMDLTYNPDTDVMYIIGYDGSKYYIYSGDLSDFVALMADGYDAGTTITLGSAWGTIAADAGLSSGTSKALFGICYDADSGILFLINDTDDKIDTLSLDCSTWSQGVYDLPSAGGGGTSWKGIAGKNGRLFVGNYTGTTSANQIYVLPKIKCSASAWFRSHIYQDPSRTFQNAGRTCFDFNGDELVCSNATYNTFVAIKTLEEPSVYQANSFLDTNNVFLSNNVIDFKFFQRTFDPEEFADINDCPDTFYGVVVYRDAGWSELHFDAFYGGYSVESIPRHDTSLIRVRHFVPDTDHVIDSASTTGVACAGVDDIYCVAVDNSGTPETIYVIDLKAGQAVKLLSTTNSLYAGTLSERNSNAGYTAINNPSLNLPGTSNGNNATVAVARTFRKEDNSDYKLAQPKTFFAFGGTGIKTNIITIDWDANNNRSLVRSVSHSSTSIGNQALFIAPSGKLFAGDYTTNGAMYYSALPIWDIVTDSWTFTQIGTNIGAGYVTAISENSQCWKGLSGTWRHILTLGVSRISGGGASKFAKLDVENYSLGLETIYADSATAERYLYGCGNFEDLSVAVHCDNTSGTSDMLEKILICKKLRFADTDSATSYFYNNWTLARSITASTRPFFGLGIGSSSSGADAKIVFFTDIMKIGVAYKYGVYLTHTYNTEHNLIETTLQSLSVNPTAYIYRANKLTPYGE